MGTADAANTGNTANTGDTAGDFLTIGIDIGGTNLRAAVVTATGEILDVEKLPTPSSVYALEVALEYVVTQLRRRHPSVAAIGLAVAGFIDETKTRVRFAPHLPWRDVAVVERMQRRLDLPVELEHDANSAAWGEAQVGVARGVDTWALFALGTGIGGALVTNGAVYRGSYGTAPEFGHLVVVPGGRCCPCGKRGCLERYCSGSALMLNAQDLMATGEFSHSALAKEHADHPEEISGRAVVRAARAEDPLALAAVRDMGRWLGHGLALVQDVLDPELIVIGGGVSSDADLFLDEALSIMKCSIVGAGHRPLAQVAVAELGGDAGMIGVALLARAKVQ